MRASLLGIEDRVEAPGPHATEFVLALVVELEPRAGGQVLDRAGHDDFARLSKRGDVGTGGNREPGHLALVQLALARMNPGAQFEPDLVDALHDPLCAPDGARRAVEGREEPVACGVPLDSPEARELPADESMVALEEPAPLWSPSSRANSVERTMSVKRT